MEPFCEAARASWFNQLRCGLTDLGPRLTYMQMRRTSVIASTNTAFMIDCT